MEENNYMEEFTNDGKRIIASITIDGEVYYIDENKQIYEKANNYYYIVTSEKIKEAVRQVLFKRSDNFLE